MIYDKDYFISEISKRSSKYGSQLVRLMEINNANSLSDITVEQAKEFYKELIDKNIDDSDSPY